MFKLISWHKRKKINKINLNYNANFFCLVTLLSSRSTYVWRTGLKSSPHFLMRSFFCWITHSFNSYVVEICEKWLKFCLGFRLKIPKSPLNENVRRSCEVYFEQTSFQKNACIFLTKKEDEIRKLKIRVWIVLITNRDSFYMVRYY